MSAKSAIDIDGLAYDSNAEMFDEIALQAETTFGGRFVVPLRVARKAPWRIVVPTGPLMGEYADGDLFDALRQLRRRLDADGTLLLCVGARADVWPSTASREVLGGRKVARLRFGEAVDATLDIFDEDTERPESVAEQDEFRARWTRAFGEPPVRAFGTWIPLDEDGRKAWLDRARDVYFLGGHTCVQARGPGTTIDLDVSTVSELTSFLCALGEAVNGPGGYFGVSLTALEDCLVGGVGMTAPWTLRVSDESHLMRVLDAPAYARWADERIAAGDFLDEEGRAWLENARDEGQSGRTTLWGAARALLIALRVATLDAASRAPTTVP